MTIFDIFKKKKESGKKKPIKEKAEIKPAVERTEISVKGSSKQEFTKQRKDTAPIYGIVKKPHISEKATNLGQINQYVFKVFSKARKSEIKKAIERIYRVDVLTVNIIAIPAKKRRLGRTMGFKQGYKKAVVKIKKGQKIEII